ncbi:MAG TPA: DNA-processing protein DprA [Planctomycetota bacterium]|nr:DNA-processing protein DprA [Planctomycetota bacterium]
MSRDPAAPEEHLFESLRLHLATLYHSGVGRSLVERFGSAPEVFRQPRGILLSLPGVTRALCRKVFSYESSVLARDEMKRAEGAGAWILPWGSDGYPALLDDLPGMPLVLYALGSGGPVSFPAEAVGIVGTRRPTPYGLRQARRFAGSLASRGIAVTSGLALGIDGEAHRAALDCGGRTLAVLGSGLGRIYPHAHRDLARRIADGTGSLLVTEFPFEAAPKSFHFPMRNRVLSGLSLGVLVVEAGARSGSLITVNHAIDQGKPVYVLPGRVDEPEAQGSLELLLEGAAPVLRPEDVLPGVSAWGSARARALPGGAVHPPARLEGKLGARLEALLAERDAWHPDQLAERLGLSPSQVVQELSRLELEGLLWRLPGGLFGRA